MKRQYPEVQLQRTVAAYLKVMLLPPDKGGAWWTAIKSLPHSSPRRGALAKALGEQAGVPDLLIVFRGRAIFLELKADGGTRSPVQKSVHRDLACAGAVVTTCHSLNAVIEFLKLTGIPTKDADQYRRVA